MVEKICSKSSEIFLLINGKIEDVLAPWKICIDFKKETIIIKKRNWYLIGINENVHAFRFIRSIDIHERLIGVDLGIKSIGNYSKVYCLRKKEVHEIKNALIEYNQKRKVGFVLS